jgi:CelD/BcsL family acetyltransferase involved in cellulose biosynthesis
MIHDLPRLIDIAPVWGTLAEASGMPTLQHAWARAAAETLLGPGDRLCVLAVSAPGGSAIAPLVRRRGWPGRVEILGMGELYEPADFIHSSGPALDLVAGALLNLQVPFFLARIPADSPMVAALKRASAQRGLLLERPACGSPWIALDESWREPESHLSSRRRSDLRRARRIAERIGPLSFEMRSPTPAELPELLEEAVQLEGAGWKGRDGSSMARDPLRGRFYLRFAALAAHDGCLRLCFLRVGGRAVAVQIAAECAGTLSLLKIGYDEAFARCSPGSLLLRESIREAAARRLRSFEFLGIPEPWTRVWTEQLRPFVSLRGYPAGGAGLARLAADTVFAAGRRLGRLGISTP